VDVLDVIAHCDATWDTATVARTPTDPRVRVIVERLSEGFGLADMKAAIDGSKYDEWIKERPKLQDVTTLLRDGAAIDKYSRMRGHKPTPPPGSPNVQPGDPKHYENTGWEDDAARGAPAEYLEPADPFATEVADV
jgi:hypothetical protein